MTLRRFELDVRSLAAGRIALAALLLVDLAQRAGDLRAHYTDQGVLPRSAYALAPWDFAWSLHRLGGSAAFEGALFALAAGFAVAFLLGYRTFWAHLGVWVLTVSLHARNPLLRDGQDDLMRVLLFFGLFLPLGAVASWDARVGRRPPRFGPPGWMGAAFVLQLGIVYWVSGLGKVLSPWWRGGEGIFYALRVGRYETAFGHWLSGLPGLAPVSFAVVLLELLGPLAWIAFERWRVRTAVAGAFIAMHLGFVLAFRLGLFPLVSIAAWLFLLPAGLWERVGWRAAVEVPRSRGVVCRGVTGVALAVVVWCNLLYLVPEARLPRWPQRVAELVGLQQYWVLFSPRFASAFAASDGWLVIPAVLQNGQQVDLQAGGKPVSWDRPAQISTTFANARWRHYFANMANLLLPFPPGSVQLATLEKSREAYGQLLCREWNDAHPAGERIAYLSLFLNLYRFDHPGEPARRELLYQGGCL